MSADSPVSILFSSAALEVANKANNTAAPDASNIGALVAVASAAAPVYTGGRLVALSTDLVGRLRVDATISSGIDRTAMGTITAVETIPISTQASGACALQITGIWTGTIVFEATVDGVTWQAVNGVIPDTGFEQSSTTVNGLWVIACAGFNQVRVRGFTVTSGTATAFLESSTATQVVVLGDPIPTGSNVIGALVADQSVNVTKVGGSALALGQTVMASSVPVTIASNQTAVPISAASLPLPAGAATAANQATEIASLANLDVALSTRLKPADTLAAVTTVTTVTAVTAITNALPTGANTIGKVDQGAGGASAWLVTGTGGTFPITAASLPLPTGAATEATLATRVADATITARLGVLGQAAMAASAPVAIASNQSYGSVSTGNTSSTPLGGAGVFTGTFEEVTNYSMVTVMVFADVASATDGLSFQWSSDGTNADRTEGSTVNASAGRAFALTTRGRYFRVVYTNGAGAQATFRLQSIYHVNGAGLITKPLDQSVTTENFAQLVQAPVMGFRSAGGTFSSIESLASAPAGTEEGLIVRNIPSGTQPVSGTVSITANSSVNVNQIAGTTTAVNNGVVGAGVQRVTLASDSTGQVTLATGANTIGALTANQSVNLNQVGGTSVVTGGVAGTQGVGGLAASGAAKAGNPNQIGGVFNTTQPTVTTGQAVEAQMTARGAQIVATGVDALNVTAAASTNDIGKVRFSLPTTDAESEIIINTSASGNNTIIAGVAAQTARVYRMFFVVSGATNIQIRDGAATGLTGVMTFFAGGSFSVELCGEPWFTTSASNAFVINQTGTAQISGRCYYTQS